MKHYGRQEQIGKVDYELSVYPKIDMLCEAYAMGASFDSLAAMCGVRPSYLKYCAREHPAFEAKLNQAKQIMLQRVRKALYSRALGEVDDVETTTTKNARGQVLQTFEKRRRRASDPDLLVKILHREGEIGAPRDITAIEAEELASKATKLMNELHITDRSSEKPIEAQVLGVETTKKGNGKGNGSLKKD